MLKTRWYQEEAVDAIWSSLIAEPDLNPLICLPTGSGKSVVLASLAKLALKHRGRVMIMAHRRELLEQNHDHLERLGVIGGIYSAGLTSRDTEDDVIFAGIQSVYRRAADFGERHLILIDEAHLVPESGEGMYRTFLQDMKTYNPHVKIAGMTATPYRTSCGDLCGPDEIFGRVVYEAPVGRLISEEFLCDLTSRSAEHHIETKGLKTVAGEYNQGEVEKRFLKAGLVSQACQEITNSCADRKSILVFTAGVKHCEQVAESLRRLTGDEVAEITGETPSILRADILEDFRSGGLRWLVNVNVLTTGFDATRIDAIAVLRATTSPGLFAQMCGRGLRIHDGKTNCLVLDFGQNLDRHGPLDHPLYGRKSHTAGESGNGKLSNDDMSGDGLQTCDGCDVRFPVQAEFCPACGLLVKRHEASATDAPVFTRQAEPEAWHVLSTSASIHYAKKTGIPLLRIDYKVQAVCEESERLFPITDWVCLEHKGYARLKASAWWKRQSHAPVPDTIDQAIDLWNAGFCVAASRVTTIADGKYNNIIERVYEDEIPEFDEDYEPDVAFLDHLLDPFEQLDEENIPF